jgi:hypothetical protein
MNYKTLFTVDGWSLHSDSGLPPMIWVWHEMCEELPPEEVDLNQHSWLTMDTFYRCILCLKGMPDELVTVIVLYK